ncbi:MAG: DUF1730 domain-containing protein [Clostridia bacterium]|nr:DUF1730 domain-containing protein [Clostridia bacterium]
MLRITALSSLPYGVSAFADVKDRLLDCRAAARLPENAQSVISVLFPYYLGEEYYRDLNVSRYAVSADYHGITAPILEAAAKELRERYPDNRFEAFVDNSPLPEVRCAVAAGLGVLGKNALFINKTYGSWVFLGEIVTDLPLQPAARADSFCIGCEKCVKACPVGAIGDTGVDAGRCLSYLTQKKGELDDAVKEKIIEYNCAWGCDVCQKVCPMNVGAAVTPIAAFFETAKAHVSADDPVENRAFAWRGKKVIERNLLALDGKEKNG